MNQVERTPRTDRTKLSKKLHLNKDNTGKFLWDIQTIALEGTWLEEVDDFNIPDILGILYTQVVDKKKLKDPMSLYAKFGLIYLAHSQGIENSSELFVVDTRGRQVMTDTLQNLDLYLTGAELSREAYTKAHFSRSVLLQNLNNPRLLPPEILKFIYSEISSNQEDLRTRREVMKDIIDPKSSRRAMHIYNYYDFFVRQ
jgi:hypothetical protein